MPKLSPVSHNDSYEFLRLKAFGMFGRKAVTWCLRNQAQRGLSLSPNKLPYLHGNAVLNCSNNEV
jgi:hypothetical protein